MDEKVKAHETQENTTICMQINSKNQFDTFLVYVAYSKTTNVPSQGSSNAAAFALAAAQWTNSAPIPKAPNELGPPCVDIKTVVGSIIFYKVYIIEFIGH